MAKKVNIELKVADASSLYAAVNPSQTTVDSACQLTDDNSGSSSDGSVKDFESNVYINQDVKWTGTTDSQGYSVAIDSIVYEPTKPSDPSASTDVDFFDSATINGTGGRSGNVTAKVKDDSNLDGKLDVYTINFSIYASGNNSKSFSIDPKLKANT
jgi:hypothetical protein